MSQPDLQTCYDIHYLDYLESRKDKKALTFEEWLTKHLGIKVVNSPEG